MKRGICLLALIVAALPAHVLGFGRVVVRTNLNAQVRLPGIWTPRVPLIRPGGTLPGPMKGIILPVRMPPRVSHILPLAAAPVLPALAAAVAVPAVQQEKAALPTVKKLLGSPGSKGLRIRLNAAFDGVGIRGRGVFVSAPITKGKRTAAKSEWKSRSEDQVSLPEEDLEAELGL